MAICFIIVVYTGVQNYLCPVDMRDIPLAEAFPDLPASLEFLQVADTVMRENSLELPTTVKEAIDLYILLTSTIDAHIN